MSRKNRRSANDARVEQLVARALKDVDANIRAILQSSPEEVSLGNRSGAAAFYKYGYNADIDTAAAEDVWSGGGTWVAPTVGQVHNVKSDNANDTAAGTGAREVTLYGLVGGVADAEAVAMNGTTDVATTKLFETIHRMRVTDSGSGGENAGKITATCAGVDSTLTAEILATEGSTLMAVYTVPDNNTLLVKSWHAGVLKGGAAGKVDLRLRVFPSGESWQTWHSMGIDSAVQPHIRHPFDEPLAIPAGATIKARAAVSVNNMEVYAGFEGRTVAA